MKRVIEVQSLIVVVTVLGIRFKVRGLMMSSERQKRAYKF